MKRKLVNYDVFKRIQEDSLSTAQYELAEAEDVLARALNVPQLKLNCFGDSTVVYETTDGTYIHANYKVDKNKLEFDAIEELVVEQDSEKKAARGLLTSMVESLLENNEAKASELFSNYLNMPVVRRDLSVNEAFKITVSKPTGKHSPLFHKKQSRSLVAKRIRAMKKTKARLGASPGAKAQLARKRAVASNKLGGSKNPRWRVTARKITNAAMKEWVTMCENVIEFIDFKTYGPIINESNVQHDDKGNVVAISIPTTHKRNEGKILTFNWKTLDSESKTVRGVAKKLQEDATFIKAMSDLKRYNAISNQSALETTLENIVSTWPNVLYLTQDELAQSIKVALESAKASNYDDKTCDFMSEGILRTAHNAFADRVKKIVGLAGEEVKENTEVDSYVQFQNIISKFYPTLDESEQSELLVFSDLYKALCEVYRVATDAGDEITRSETVNFLKDCEAILNRQDVPNLELAEAIAEYLYELAESNLDVAGDWDVSNTVHTSVNGDHPDMAKKAGQGYTPASDFAGGDSAPVADGKNLNAADTAEMRNSSWVQYGGDDTFPSLKNPYVPAAGEFTMKGEKGADKDGEDDWSRWQSGDTWPNLQNPYVPAEVKSIYKMKSDNLIIDK